MTLTLIRLATMTSQNIPTIMIVTTVFMPNMLHAYKAESA